jgi:hypothetical protein
MQSTDYRLEERFAVRCFTDHSNHSGFPVIPVVPYVGRSVYVQSFHNSGRSVSPVVPYVRSFCFSPVALVVTINKRNLKGEAHRTICRVPLPTVKSNRLLILLLQTETEIRCLYQSCMFKRQNNPSSIPAVRDHYLTFASFPTPLIFHFLLPLREEQYILHVKGSG